MNIPEAILPLWREFEAQCGGDTPRPFPEAFHFDDNEPSANELGQLVLSGTKRATAGLLWVFEAEQRPFPEPGDLSVVTDWEGRPLCVIETRVVEVVPYEEVPESFARIEGEGDKTLRTWRADHWAFFGRECGRLGREPTLRMPVVCEQFEVIYPAAAAANT